MVYWVELCTQLRKGGNTYVLNNTILSTIFKYNIKCNLSSLLCIPSLRYYMYIQSSIYDICFLFLIEPICCDPSSEPYRRDVSDEGSQPMFLCNINKKHPQLSLSTSSYLELWYWLRHVFFTFFANGDILYFSGRRSPSKTGSTQKQITSQID